MRIGNMDLHGSSSHQVTDCLHRHSEQKNYTGAMKISPVSSDAVQGAGQEGKDAFPEWTPLDWLRNLLNRGRHLGLRLRGSDIPGTAEGMERGTGRASSGESGLPGRESQTSRHGTEEYRAGVEQMPPYFVLPEKKEPARGILQRMFTKVHSVSGYLEKHLPFTHTGSFHAKQQNKEEDLRRRSRYRKDELEIECILTDESFLLDSYNGKGEYSKLSTDNRKSESRRPTETGGGLGRPHIPG